MATPKKYPSEKLRRRVYARALRSLRASHLAEFEVLLELERQNLLRELSGEEEFNDTRSG